MKNAANRIRRIMLSAAGNVSLFVFVTFFATSLLFLGPQFWWREYVDMLERYVVIPWGMALCLLRLERRTRDADKGVSWDLGILFVLLLWIVVPFAIRFGNTFNNSGSWHNHTVLFFGIYATIVESSAKMREKLFDLAGVLFSAASFVLGAALIYCALTVQKFGDYEYAFGICDGIYLSAFTHYNITGMVAVCCAMMSLSAFFRSKWMPIRLLSLVSVMLMTIVAVLTQSRTARYVLIAAYALGAYGYLSANLRLKKAVLRHGAGVLAAVMLAAVCCVAVEYVSDAAIAHYNDVKRTARPVAIIPGAYAEAPDDPAEQSEAHEQHESSYASAAQELKGRVPAENSFSGRTGIWRNLLNRWREYPKYLLIGHGITRIGRLVTENTIHEGREAVSIHNAYLQYAADYGLIGFALLCAFFAVILVPVLRVFFARGEKQHPGYRPLCMLVIASLMTGMMESAPLSAMTPMNMMLFFSLALLAARGKERDTL